MVFTVPNPHQLKNLCQTGDRLFDQGQLETALKTFQEGLEIALTSNKYEAQINIFSRIGLVYRRLEKYNHALKFLELSLEIAEKVDNKLEVAMILNDIGETYCLSVEYPTALRYYAQALENFENIYHPVGIGTTLNNLGEIYNLLGLFDHTLNCCQKSINIFHRIERKSEYDKLITQINIAKALYNLGEAYFWLGHLTKAQEILKLTLVIRQKIWKITVNRCGKNTENFSQNYDSNTLTQEAKLIPQQEDDFPQSITAQYGADLSNTINLIEQVYRNLGKQQKAEKLHQQNLKLREKFNYKYAIYNSSTLPFYLRFPSH